MTDVMYVMGGGWKERGRLFGHVVDRSGRPLQPHQTTPRHSNSRTSQVGRSIKGVKKALGSWAKAKGLEKNKRQQYGGGCVSCCGCLFVYTYIYTHTHISICIPPTEPHHPPPSNFTGSGGAPVGFGCAHALILSKVKANLGLHHTKMCITSAAPISVEVGPLCVDIYVCERGRARLCAAPMIPNPHNLNR